METSLTRLYPLKLPFELSGSGIVCSESAEGANWCWCMNVRQMTTHHLHVAFNDTPKVPTPDLNRVASCQAAGLQMTAQFVENRLLKISKDTNSREKVIEVGMKGV